MRAWPLLTAAAGGAMLAAAACGTSGDGSAGWLGKGADAGYIESGTVSGSWPQADPDPDGGTHEAPSFGAPDAGDGGVGPPLPVRCSGKTAGAGDSTVLLTSGGIPRSSFLHVP